MEAERLADEVRPHCHIQLTNNPQKQRWRPYNVKNPILRHLHLIYLTAFPYSKKEKQVFYMTY
jgi:hypothetical protein